MLAIIILCVRTFVAPLERLKLEYIVRGEQRNLFDLIKHIAATQGLRGFWKGNFVNILRTAPFKAVNFYAYDTYRKQLLKLSGNEETTNFERFVAGAAAGITAAVLCIPLDTVWFIWMCFFSCYWFGYIVWKIHIKVMELTVGSECISNSSFSWLQSHHSPLYLF